MAKEYLDFFKVFLNEKHSDRMLIPKAFVKMVYSKQRVLKDFILRDCRGRDWNIKTCRIGNDLYFDDGWKLFREKNCLEENDFIFFTHVENNVFKFKIHELSTMCEKINVMDEEEENNTEVDDEDEDDDDYDEDDGDDVMVFEEEDSDEDGEEERGYMENSKSEHYRTCKALNTERSSSIPNLEDDEIDIDIYVQPGNPCFFAKHVYYRPNELYIPKNAIKDLCLCSTKHITLVCCHCKDVQSNEIAAYHHVLPQSSAKHTEMKGDVSKWRDGRVFVKGWEDFCKRSKISENHRCLCELVLRESGSIEMLRVHIVH